MSWSARTQLLKEPEKQRERDALNLVHSSVVWQAPSRSWETLNMLYGNERASDRHKYQSKWWRFKILLFARNAKFVIIAEENHAVTARLETRKYCISALFVLTGSGNGTCWPGATSVMARWQARGAKCPANTHVLPKSPANCSSSTIGHYPDIDSLFAQDSPKSIWKPSSAAVLDRKPVF